MTKAEMEQVGKAMEALRSGHSTEAMIILATLRAVGSVEGRSRTYRAAEGRRTNRLIRELKKTRRTRR